MKTIENSELYQKEQLNNLWAVLNIPHPTHFGMSKLIGDGIRFFTQVGSGRVYSITKKLKEKFNEYGVDVPNSMTHYQLKGFTKKVPFQTMTEHTTEIKQMTKFLLGNLSELRNMDEETRLEYLNNYFKKEIKMFHKLKVEEKHLQTRKGMTIEMMLNELVEPENISIKF